MSTLVVVTTFHSERSEGISIRIDIPDEEAPREDDVSSMHLWRASFRQRYRI
nr:MAG TPA: hypothetical protein [Caudoviricetes sp.]